jgi:DNA-binding IclR family transcriptional regulator
MSIGETTADELNRQSIIDDHGRPKDELTLKILRLFFSPPFPPRHPKFSATKVATLLAAPEKTVDSILKQLKQEDFLTEDMSQSGLYQYNYNCIHVERQVELEKAFV